MLPKDDRRTVTVQIEADLDLLGAAASILALVVGAIGPWVTALGITSVSGLSGDGWIVLGAAVFAAAALYRHWRGGSSAAPVFVLGLVAGGVGAYHWYDISGSDSALVQAGWGLILSTLAGGALAFFGLRLAGYIARDSAPVPARDHDDRT